jgi:signal transduction histidine kinase
MDAIKNLFAELQLIQVWDTNYLEKRQHRQVDDSYRHRQIMRREIIEKLRVLVGTAAKPERCRLAHDLANNLAVILGNCEILLDGSGVSPEQSKRLQAIRDASRSMTQALRSHTCPIATPSKESSEAESRRLSLTLVNGRSLRVND